MILTPSEPDMKCHSTEFVLVVDGTRLKPEEITFEGEEEAENRIAGAMLAYDTAMDQAAGIKIPVECM